MFVIGGRFNRMDVLKIGAEPGSPQTLNLTQTRGRKLSQKWPDWVAEVVLLSEEEWIGDLSANGLIEKIATRLAEKGKEEPSGGTVAKASQAIITTLQTARRLGKV